jgi:hypothetical protein
VAFDALIARLYVAAGREAKRGFRQAHTDALLGVLQYLNPTVSGRMALL